MTQIRALRRLEETTTRLGGMGDNWHMTWAADDLQYAGLCDGAGWPNQVGYTGKVYNARIFTIRGDPPQPQFTILPGYPDLYSEEPPYVNRYYGFGILAYDGHIYQFLSTPYHIFSPAQPRFVGAKLIYSVDSGKSWRNQDGTTLRWEAWEERSRENMLFFNEPGEAFSLITVLQMGQNYAYNQDGYVYLYSPNGNREGTMNQLVLARVPKDRLLERDAYEFYANRQSDGSARWVKNIAERGILMSFPSGWVNQYVHPYAWHPSVVYYAPLGLYLMANWGMGCAADGMWFGKPSYLGFWTAPQPWGPWTQVHEETAWMPASDPAARAYQPQIAPRWIAPDGKSFWLVWTDFQTISGRMPYYSFNTQKVEVVSS
jgi:hypothetical protein